MSWVLLVVLRRANDFGPNLYGYVRNRPLRAIDPSGTTLLEMIAAGVYLVHLANAANQTWEWAALTPNESDQQAFSNGLGYLQQSPHKEFQDWGRLIGDKYRISSCPAWGDPEGQNMFSSWKVNILGKMRQIYLGSDFSLYRDKPEYVGLAAMHEAMHVEFRLGDPEAYAQTYRLVRTKLGDSMSPTERSFLENLEWNIVNGTSRKRFYQFLVDNQFKGPLSGGLSSPSSPLPEAGN